MKKNETRFGLFTTMALIVGIVIGSGIFVKNETIINGTGNEVSALIAWVVGTVLVLLTVLSFLEIMSISSKKNKPGTLIGWTNDLIGPKTGAAIGIITIITFLSVDAAAYPFWAADKILTASGSALSSWNWFWATTAIGVSLSLILFFMSLASRKASKGFANTALVVKFIPLLLVIVGGIVIVAMGNFYPISSDQIPGTNPPSSNEFINIMTVLPAILFTFNGFISSASLMPETKDKKTYQRALVLGMVVVSVVYISYTVFTFTSVDGANGYGLYGAMLGIFGTETTEWLFPTMQAMIIISILSALLSLMIGSSRQYSSLSEEGFIKDPNGTLLKRNNQLVPQYAAYHWLVIVLVIMFVGRSIDAIAIHTGTFVVGMEGSTIPSLDYATDLAAIMAFFGYAMVIAAAIANRFTNRVETDRVKGFMIFAPLAVISISLVMGFQVYYVFETLINSGNWVYITTMLLMIASWFAFWGLNKKIGGKNPTKFNKAKKNKYIRDFNNLIIDPDLYKSNIFTFIPKK